jgi:hypothetical protein
MKCVCREGHACHVIWRDNIYVREADVTEDRIEKVGADSVREDLTLFLSVSSESHVYRPEIHIILPTFLNDHET